MNQINPWKQKTKTDRNHFYWFLLCGYSICRIMAFFSSIIFWQCKITAARRRNNIWLLTKYSVGEKILDHMVRTGSIPTGIDTTKHVKQTISNCIVYFQKSPVYGIGTTFPSPTHQTLRVKLKFWLYVDCWFRMPIGFKNT